MKERKEKIVRAQAKEKSKELKIEDKEENQFQVLGSDSAVLLRRELPNNHCNIDNHN